MSTRLLLRLLDLLAVRLAICGRGGTERAVAVAGDLDLLPVVTRGLERPTVVGGDPTRAGDHDLQGSGFWWRRWLMLHGGSATPDEGEVEAGWTRS
jgi:hypothetical protein